MDIRYTEPETCLIDRPIEPGLLEGFRFYYVLRAIVGFTLFTILLLLGRFEPIVLVGITMGLLMLGYVTSARLHTMMGKWYLPVGLAVSVVETLFVEKMLRDDVLVGSGNYADFLAQLTFPMNVDPFLSNMALEVWRVFPPLFFLLIFISWQYSMREVGLFILFVAAMEFLLPVRLGVEPQTQIILTLTIVFVRSIAFMVVGFLITQLVAGQRKQRYELSVAQAKLTNYATVIETLSISRERNRLAHELHDTLAHTLSAASVQLEAVNSLWDAHPDKAHNQLQRALKITRDGLQETRRALQSLRASPLEDLGLVLALHELAESTEHRSGTIMHMTMPEQPFELPAQVEQTVYRVAQEALENITRHAHANNATLSLRLQDRAVHLEVCDDGAGFVPMAVDHERHFGLRGMKERVDALGGQIHINSQPGQGTQVHLTMGV